MNKAPLKHLAFCCSLLICLLLGLVSAMALPVPSATDNRKTEYNHARLLLDFDQYDQAFELFQRLLKDDPENSNLNFLAGYCLYYIRPQRSKSIPYLRRAIQRTAEKYHGNRFLERTAPVFAFYYLGLACHYADQLDDALLNLKQFRSFLIDKSGHLIKRKNEKLLKDVSLAIDQVNKAKALMSKPLKVVFSEIIGLNTPGCSDFGAQMAEDGNKVFFTREKIEGEIYPKLDMMLMRKQDSGWYSPEFIDEKLRSKCEDKFCYVSPDEKLLMFASDRDGDYAIYYSLKEDGRWMPASSNLRINTFFNEFSAVLSKDGNRLLFVSDRSGGFGGKDIYSVDKKPDGSWASPQNLGFTINTPYDEDTPWLSDNGDTLFFSSEGHGSMGGFDIFYSEYKNGMWQIPKNMGYPINTVSDELYFKTMGIRRQAIFSSNRRGDQTVFNTFIIGFPLTK